jgi:hypothetical protein
MLPAVSAAIPSVVVVPLNTSFTSFAAAKRRRRRLAVENSMFCLIAIDTLKSFLSFSQVIVKDLTPLRTDPGAMSLSGIL